MEPKLLLRLQNCIDGVSKSKTEEKIKRHLVVFLRPAEKNLIVFSAASFINSELPFTEYSAIYIQRITLIQC